MGLPLPRGEGRRGGLGGEGDVAVELRFAGNSSPDLAPAAVVVSRGRMRRSAGRRITTRCQNEAQGRKEEKESKKGSCGRRSSPEMELLADGDGGLRRWFASGLVA